MDRRKNTIPILKKQIEKAGEAQVAHILSAFPLVGETVKAAAMEEFRQQ